MTNQTKQKRTSRKKIEATQLTATECEFLEEVRHLRASLAVYRQLVERLLIEARS